MNALEGIKYEDNTFDYVHMRLLCVAVTEDYWPLYMKDLARVCSPANAGPLGQEVNSWFTAVCRSRNVNMDKAWQIPQMMQEAGLQVEVEHFIEIPIGEWCDQVGRHGWTDYYNLISPLCAKIMSTCNVTKERFDYVLANLHEENVAHRVYRKMGIFVGRKP
ncbi:hypothetical protein BDF19DRAFT_436795 [Syncephalis fuscata]|nr:hypothetical protein BDF19DRAFT_436795 [Syncephalis fuscata]